eukprot:12898816-Prorocentrum_lima.AAC.1
MPRLRCKAKCCGAQRGFAGARLGRRSVGKLAALTGALVPPTAPTCHGVAVPWSSVRAAVAIPCTAQWDC